MVGRSLRIVNESSDRSSRAADAVNLIERAVAVQLRDVARAWGQYVWRIVDDANMQGFSIVLLDDSDSAGALGYHDVNESDGTPYARVFLDPIRAAGGSWLRGNASVSATVSHDACEMVGDPIACHWVETARGSLVARELCDPVESSTYTIQLRNNRRVSVSNFLYPDWFNSFAPLGARFDHMQQLHKPFQTAPGGYTIRNTPSGVRNLWGPEHPRWRRDAKKRVGSRTFSRHR